MAKRIGIIALQLLVTAAGMWYVFHDPQKRTEIMAALRQADKTWLLIGWCCYGLVEVLASVRWQILLRIQGIVIHWLRTFAFVMIGLFFNMFLPGLVGGDAMRLYFVFQCAPRRKTRATLSVAMDRLLGLLSILLLAGLTVGFRFAWLSQSPTTLHIACLAVGLLAGSFLFVLFLFSAVEFGWLYRLPRRTPLRKTIIQSGQALQLYRKHAGSTLAAFGTTILSHLAYYLSFYAAAQSLRSSGAGNASLIDFLTMMPLVNTVTALPISFGGLGLRETLFQELLGNLAHVPLGVAALAASLGFAIQASWGCLGAGTYFLSRKFHAR